MFSADLGGYTAPPPAATDPPFQKVALLLHGDGTNGAQNNTFVDSSSNNFTITRTGNVAQGTFSPFSLAEGQWSNYFLKSAACRLSATNATIAPSTGDFSMECWMYADRNNTTMHVLCIGESSGSGRLFLSLGGTTGRLSWNQYGSGAQIYTASNLIQISTWYHVVVTRVSGYMRIFVNGVLQGAGTNTDSYTQTKFLIGGIAGNTSEGFDGCLSNVRYLNGSVPTAYQTSSTTIGASIFTPPTTSLTAITNTSLLTCRSNRFKDNSSNNFTITSNGDTKVTAFSPFAPSAAYDASTNGGSGYFDGSGDYLTISGQPLSLTGNFTVEFWVYIPIVANHFILYLSGDSGTIAGLRFDVTSSSQIRLLMSTNGSWQINSSGSAGTVDINSWTHIAITRNGGTITLYKNGVSVYSSTAISSGSSLWNGTFNRVANVPGEGTCTGYVSNLRVVNGTVLYTSNFTPPTTPLTAVANTQLLLNCTNAGIIDNSGKNDIETVGNAQISTSIKKYGTGSMYFDGTGDYLNITDKPLNILGDFTVEFWSYILSTKTQTLLQLNGDIGTGAALRFTITNTDQIQLLMTSSSAANWLINSGGSAGTITKNIWQHIAIVRNNGTIKIYVDGTSVYSSTAISSTKSLSNATLNIIGTLYGQSSHDYYGYIDDLRITKGQALYTSNFTPPTQAFPNV